MDFLNIGENIVKLRRQKGITQEALADFIGVTKASVSKWETKQSLPDILLLPQLAAFFDVSVDELLGYSPQLTKEQITKHYQDLAQDFAQLPFDKVMEKSQELAKTYYSCYPFLFYLSLLWVNHHMLASNPQEGKEILAMAERLCRRIEENCRDISLCRDAASLKAMINLQQGNVKETAEQLEELTNPYSLERQNDILLIQAYQIMENKEKASAFGQITMYLHLNSLVSAAQQYLIIHLDDKELGEETIRRIDIIAEGYNLETLNPNLMASFNYQTAAFYVTHEENDKALNCLEKYVNLCRDLFRSFYLHGDSYFTSLEQWIDQGQLRENAPRNKKVVWESALAALNNPAFEPIKETPEFKLLFKELAKEGEKQ